MRAVAAAAAAAAAIVVPALAGCLEELPGEAVSESEVVGGANAAAGKWPDVAAVLWSGQLMCTGVLIAPTVALTAGHCNDPTLTKIIVGTSSLARATEGETINVVKRIEYPSSRETEDLTVLVLERPSRLPPRAIATGWARADILDGAAVAIAGYGAIDRDATKYVSELQEAETAITDADCTEKPGCHAVVAPGGELGAGGMGTDTCPGDSGGPLYLLTSYGEFLAGITSRSYADALFDCSEGGIYARPDRVIDWIEESAGVPVARGPEPAVDAITVVRGRGAETSIRVGDPKTKKHTFSVVEPPSRGAAKVRDDGRVRVCIDPEAAPGDDAVTVKIADRARAARAVSVRIPVVVEDGEPEPDCSVDDFEGGGCCDSGRGGRGSIPLALGVLAALRRRRSPVLR
ncbi:MAG TPA: trypsin-like serine protease [Kofleriaceae bacterium]|nr:trypsin-like serine protease [Kofleriaceae bacterium]